MSKKFLYNGSIKWYINYEKKENKIPIPIPIPSLLTRKYIKEEGTYKIFLSKYENIQVSNEIFIEQLRDYKRNKEDKDRNRINENKVFFELKEGQKTRKNTIICQSEELGKFNKSNKNYISKIKIEEFIEKEKLNIQDEGSIIYKDIKTRKTEKIITYIKKEVSRFEKTKKEKSILVEILNDETIKERNCVLEKMIYCNKELYKVIKETFKMREDELNSFSWKENIRNIIDSKIEGKTIEAINEVFSSSEKDFAISNMKISMNEEKLIFLNKLLKNENIEVNKEMIVEYLYNILLSKNILKRVDKIYKKDDEKADDYFIKTYIENDIHTKDKDRLKETIKYYLDNENKLEEDIKEILTKYSYKEIFNSIYTTIKNEEISFSESRKLLGKYKEEYTKYNSELKNIIGSENREKELAKTIYRYGKGRIKKIALNKNLFEKIKKEGIDFYYDSFKDKKILKAIKSKFLEEILFTGKKEHENLDGNVLDFQRRHAYDELFNEYLALISNVKFEAGKLSGEENTDISTSEDREKIIEGIKKSEKNIPEEIKANDKLFKYYLEEIYLVRNKIIHGKIDDILSKSNESEEHEENFNELEVLLNNRKISDEDISKNISANLVFQDKDKISKIKEINTYIEELKLEEVNDKIKNLYGIMPSYSKIVSKISKSIEFSENINLKDKDIVSNAVVYVFKHYYNYLINNEEYILSLGKDILAKKDNDKKEGSGIDENNIDNVCDEITKYYRRVQRTSSKGNPKPFRNFQKTLIDFFIKYIKYDYNKKNYNILFDFKNVSELNKIEGNKENNIVIKSIKENITIDNQLEYITLYSAILVDPIVSNMIRNRFNATVQWLKNMDLTYDNTKKHINLFENIYKKLSIVKTYTDDRELSELEKMSKAKIKQNEEEKRELDKKIDSTKKNVRCLVEGIKKYIESIDCVKYEISEEDKIYGIGVDKDFLDMYKEIDGDDIFIEGKVLKSFKVEFKNKVLIDKELAFEKTLKDKLEKIKNKMEEYKKAKKDKEQKNISIDENYSNKTKKAYYELELSNEKLKEKFLQGLEGNEIAVFQKHRYLAINRPIFEEIFDKFLKEYLEKIGKKELIEYDYVSFSKVDNFLNKFNLNMKNKSKRFKESEVERLKNNDEYFEKNYKEINSLDGFKSYNEFEKEYKNKGKYMLQENLLNFELVNKIYRHIVMINYKLQIHISRFERDCHYFVRGINDIFKDVKFYEEEFDKEWSVAYKKDKNHYKWIMYEKIKKYFEFFNFKIPKKGEGEKGIRNYIAHFYMLRKTFDSSIIEKVEEVNNFMEYRSKYQNAVLKSVFEIFKKDCDIEYSFLDKKQEKLNKEFLDKVLKRKKITDFKLDYYLKCYYKFLKEVLLYKKN